ncbi:hypothetical protein [Malacoplasma iowae]|nr:hypothetical protein [Malacoplasma iowae]WPL40076.1 hypothetical protein QX183_00810 [Malacoplasma iowae]
MNFLNILYNNKNYEISFNGIKIFQVRNPNKFSIDFINQAKG